GPPADRRHHQRAAVRALAHGQDLGLGLGAEPPRLAVWGRGALAQRRPAAGVEAVAEPVDGRAVHARAGGGPLGRHPLEAHLGDDLAARLPREPLASGAASSVQHAEPPLRDVELDTPTLSGGSDYSVSRRAGVWSIHLARRQDSQRKPVAAGRGASGLAGSAPAGSSSL